MYSKKAKRKPIFLQSEITAFCELTETELPSDITENPYWSILCVLFTATDHLLLQADEAKHTGNIDFYVKRSARTYEDYENEIIKKIENFTNAPFSLSIPEREILLMYFCMTRGILYRQYDNTIYTIKKKRLYQKSGRLFLFLSGFGVGFLFILLLLQFFPAIGQLSSFL